MEGPWVTNHWKYRDLHDQNSSKGVDMTNFQNLRDYKCILQSQVEGLQNSYQYWRVGKKKWIEN